jgi:hypothetical protein
MKRAFETRLTHLNEGWIQRRVPSSEWRDREYALYFQQFCRICKEKFGVRGSLTATRFHTKFISSPSSTP